MRIHAWSWTVLIASLRVLLACGHSTNTRHEQPPGELVELDLQVTYDQYLAETRIFTTATIILAGNEPGVVNLVGKRQLVGYVYRIEGYLDGQPVVYIGSAASIKDRLNASHAWANLPRQETTVISAKKVYADISIAASNRGTPLSAQREALRSMEEYELRRARSKNQGKSPDQTNRRYSTRPGPQRTRPAGKSDTT